MVTKSCIKLLAKQAKKRLNNGYWENYYTKLIEVSYADSNIDTSKIVAYYEKTLQNDIHNVGNDEEFYAKVKNMLDENGEVGNALGILTDKEYYNTLDYDKQQRYNLDLSARYRLAVERYNAEREIEKMHANSKKI